MRDLFYIVKKHCSLKWKDLGRSLGFEEAALEVVDAKHKDAGESCMEMLSTWWHSACREATPQTLLADALTNAGLREVADLIEEYVSDGGSSNTSHDESCSTRQAPETSCNNKVFQHVAYSIGDNWKVLARHLDGGVTEAVLRGIEKQFDQNAKECCRHVLENWKQRNGRVATLETLRTLLRAAGLAEIADNIDDGDGFHLGDEGTKIKTEAGHDVGSAAAELSAKGLRKRFQTVADVIGDGWKQLALHLEKNDRQIRGIEHEHNGNTRECCLHVLDEWKLQRGNQVAAETLNEALRSAGLVDIVSSIQDDGPGDRHQLLEDATIVGKDSQRPSQEFTERDHRNVTMLFKRIPRQGTFGDRRLERVCSKVAIYMDNLKEQGDWNTYDRFVTKAFGLYEDKPDIMIRITLEDIAASYYRGDLARGYKRAHFAQDLLLKTQDPQHHQAHLMYLKSAILRRRKRYDEAEGAIILARQGLEFIQIGRDSGEIWYNVAALFAEVLNEKVVDQPDLWERDVVPSLQSTIDHYRRSLEKDDDDSCRNKLRRAHIRLSMALMHCWSQVSREKHVQQRAIPAVDLRRAENSLLEVENNLWEDISERMECSWLLAKSDLMCLRGSYRRATQLASNVLTIAQKASFPAETTFARDRLELLKQAAKTEAPRISNEEDILRDLSICDDDAVKNLSAEKVPKSNTDPRSETCAVMPEFFKADGRETDTMQRRHATKEQNVSSTFGGSYLPATSASFPCMPYYGGDRPTSGPPYNQVQPSMHCQMSGPPPPVYLPPGLSATGTTNLHWTNQYPHTLMTPSQPPPLPPTRFPQFCTPPPQLTPSQHPHFPRMPWPRGPFVNHSLSTGETTNWRQIPPENFPGDRSPMLFNVPGLIPTAPCFLRPQFDQSHIDRRHNRGRSQTSDFQPPSKRRKWFK